MSATYTVNGYLGHTGFENLAARSKEAAAAAKTVLAIAAAPLVGLAYVVAFPFVGAGALVYIGVKALRN